MSEPDLALQAAVEDATLLLLEVPQTEDGERWGEDRFEAFGRILGYLFPDDAWWDDPRAFALAEALGYVMR